MSSHNTVNFGLLAAEICWRVWGTRANFNGFRVLVVLLHGTLVVGVNQTSRRWTEGATYIRQGGHHVGHWPTFLVTYLFYKRRKHDISCNSVCCVCGVAWSSRWLMTPLTNGQHACVLVFASLVDILNIAYLLNVNLFSLYLMKFMSYTTLDALGNILRVNCESMKCDFSLSQGVTYTLFRWGEHISCMCKVLFLLMTVQKV